jgi:hypothetical protein
LVAPATLIYGIVRPLMPSRRSVLLLVWLGLLAATVFVAQGMGFHDSADLPSFYGSARAWMSGQSPYQLGSDIRPNLNTPPFLVLFAPFARGSISVAWWTWSALGAVLLIDALRRVRRVLSSDAVLGVLALLLISTPSWLAWRQGQVTWVLAYFVTRAWLAPSDWRRAAWLAPAIVLKPPLVFFALALPYALMWRAGVLASSMTLVSVLLQGPELWRTWLVQQVDVMWLALAANLSWFGQLARVQVGIRPIGLAGLSGIGVGFVALVAVATRVALAPLTGARRWAVAWLWALLASPYGWMYYLPVAFAPMAASTPHPSRWIVPLIIFLAPLQIYYIFNQWAILGPIVASVPCAGATWMLWAWYERPVSREP